MYTWYVWRALNTPPTKNPLFRQMQIDPRASWLDRFWNGFAVLLIALLFLQPPLFVILLLSIPLVYPIVSSTCYGALFALRTASMIYTRRQRGSYDLICIAPGGAWEACLAVCAGSVHRNGDLDRLHRHLSRIITILFTLGVFGIVASFVVPTDRLKNEFLVMAVILFTIISLMYLEFTQSSVLSTLVGMVFAIHARNPIDSRIGSLSGFLAFQMVTYLTAVVLAISLLYPVVDRADLPPVVGMLLGCVALVGYVSILRETIVFVLWRLISCRLNAARDDIVNRHWITR